MDSYSSPFSCVRISSPYTCGRASKGRGLTLALINENGGGWTPHASRRHAGSASEALRTSQARRSLQHPTLLRQQGLWAACPYFCAPPLRRPHTAPAQGGHARCRSPHLLPASIVSWGTCLEGPETAVLPLPNPTYLGPPPLPSPGPQPSRNIDPTPAAPRPCAPAHRSLQDRSSRPQLVLQLWVVCWRVALVRHGVGKAGEDCGSLEACREGLSCDNALGRAGSEARHSMA